MNLRDESQTPVPDADGCLPDEPLAQAAVVARLIDESSQPFLIADFDGRITHTNRAFQEMLGYSAHEMRGMEIRSFTAPGRWAPTERAFAELARTGKAQRYEKEYIRKDGHRVPVALVTDYYRDERGQPVGYFAFATDISEQRRAEVALRASEERFRRLYDEAPVGYHEIDAEGKIVSINLTECDMLGYSREEMLGRPILDFVAPNVRETARANLEQRLRGERPSQVVERHHQTKDGRELLFSIQNRLLRNPDGTIRGIRSIVTDITRSKQIEQALISSERRARALFEGIDDSVFVHDLGGQILDANPAACRRLGYTREEFLRLNTCEIDASEFAAGFAERLQCQLREGHLSCEGRHRTKDGRTIPVEINTSTLQLEGQPVVIAVIRDITERKALEATRRQLDEDRALYLAEIEQKNRELTQSETRYRQLTEGSLDAIIVADESGRITLFNPAASRAFGYDPAEVLGQPIARLIPDDTHAEDGRGFAQFLETRTSTVVGRTVELNGRRKDGSTFPLELALSAIELEGRPQFLGSIRDLTERQRMRDMLIQSEKLASIGLLSAGVAHEINNPLAYIGNNLAVLDRDLKSVFEMVAAYESSDGALEATAPEVVERVRALREEMDWDYVRTNLDRMLARTRDGVQRVANIVQNLRGLARTSPPQKEEVTLADLVAGAVEMVQGQLRRKGIELVIDAPADQPKIACVATQISQVILNLLVNAVQAIESLNRPSGNAITIRLGRSRGSQFLEVSDTGPGIPAEAMPKLFDPFFTTKPVGEGTGLGLSISHGIITGHGGRIEVESLPGKGATFRIGLPEATRSR